MRSCRLDALWVTISQTPVLPGYSLELRLREQHRRYALAGLRQLCPVVFFAFFLHGELRPELAFDRRLLPTVRRSSSMHRQAMLAQAAAKRVPLRHSPRVPSRR